MRPTPTLSDLTKSDTMVLVTGASGFVAMHCVKQLLEAGYRVRGSVRSKTNMNKVGPLMRLPYASDRLELYEADLLNPEQWEGAIKGCTYVLHVASPWPIVADESCVKTAVEGTTNVLKAAANVPELKKIVLTSSCSAVNDGHKNSSRVFDETCWTNLDSDRVEYYARSKTLAEQAAWKLWGELPEESRYQLTVLNPTLIFGPCLSDQDHGCATIVKRMMDFRTYLAAPKVSIGAVDVRDVARAHLECLTRPATDGERILVTSSPSIWFHDMLTWLYDEFKSQGYMISSLEAPNWVVRVYSKLGIDAQVSAVMHRLGPELRFDNSKSLSLLGMSYIHPRESVITMAYSMLDHGMIKHTRGYTKRQQKVRDNKAQSPVKWA